MTHLNIPNSSSLVDIPPPPLPQSTNRRMDEEQPNQMARKVIHSSPGVTMNHIHANYQPTVEQIKPLNETIPGTSSSEIDGNNMVAGLSEEIDKTLIQSSKTKKRNKKRHKRVPKPSREKLHQQIDEWRQKRHEELINEKKLENNQKIARKSLNDNSRRIQEALDLITKLQKTVELQTITPSEDNKDQIIKLQQLILVWQDTLNEYRTEKRELEDILGVKEDPEQMWIECLFGNSNGESWLPNSTLKEFFTNRTHWDQFLSSDSSASSIPFFWVMPPSTPTSSPDDRLWNEYRV